MPKPAPSTLLISKQALEALEAKYPRCSVVTGKSHKDGAPPPWQCVFRSPTRSAYKAFRSRAHNPAQKADAQELLARETVVWVSNRPDAPDAATVKASFGDLLEDYPGIGEAASSALSLLAGVSVDDSGKESPSGE